MALITDIVCSECGEMKHEVTDHSGVCATCRLEITSRTKRMALAALTGLTVEERIARLEAILYELKSQPRPYSFVL